ncbi:TlpA disulfide reductase family protein [Bacillus alkalicellulosilyticus]|uniref:TlpA disulfide reductase family protein n=1 Tax=Alkalihalobacterium alkalicellulosilyticum TaxID=1912214 RepID=UPI0009960592|nr:TlpA disulfide reductase family protein [Bacillus alkalicellulosilyticus]
MKAPAFSLKDINDLEIALTDFKGKPVMITFWASWCPDSIKDLHQKNELFTSMDKDKLVFLTINVTGREGHEGDGPKFIAEQGYKFPVLLDKGTKTYDSYRCMGVPTTILLDKDQNIVATFNDRSTFMDIMNGLTKLV